MTLIEELRTVQSQSLDTLPAKVIYMILRNNKDATGWTTISLHELANITGLSLTGVKKILNRLQAVSLIEKSRTGLKACDASKYRVVEL